MQNSTNKFCKGLEQEQGGKERNYTGDIRSKKSCKADLINIEIYN